MHLATKYKWSLWFVQEVGVLPLRVKEHTCSLKIICLNFRKGEMRLLFLANQKLNLNTPLPAKKKTAKAQAWSCAYCLLPGAKNEPKGQIIHVILASLCKYQLNLSTLDQDYYGKIIIYQYLWTKSCGVTIQIKVLHITIFSYDFTKKNNIWIFLQIFSFTTI